MNNLHYSRQLKIMIGQRDVKRTLASFHTLSFYLDTCDISLVDALLARQNPHWVLTFGGS